MVNEDDVRLAAGEQLFVALCHLLVRLLTVLEDLSRTNVRFVISPVLLLKTL
jgi:hypothetical protein